MDFEAGRSGLAEEADHRGGHDSFERSWTKTREALDHGDIWT